MPCVHSTSLHGCASLQATGYWLQKSHVNYMTFTGQSLAAGDSYDKPPSSDTLDAAAIAFKQVFSDFQFFPTFMVSALACQR